jgi:hypothetical protein
MRRRSGERAERGLLQFDAATPSPTWAHRMTTMPGFGRLRAAYAFAAIEA